MKLERLTYVVGAEVTFTKPEYELLIELAKSHYDFVCQQAGLSCADGARENGFLAQLAMFPTAPKISTACWSFRELDITAKILEQRRLLTSMHWGAKGERLLALADKLWAEVNAAMWDINAEAARLSVEREAL